VDLLEEQSECYLENIKKVQDEFGFVHNEGCDSLLFSALTGLAVDVDLLAARDGWGQWFRKPAKNCYSNYLLNQENENTPGWEKLADSKSTISKDMLLGVIFWAVFHERLDVLEDLYEYGKRKEWVMGKGPLSRTYIGGLIAGRDLRHLLIEAIGTLKRDPNVKRYSYTWIPMPDYQAHLQTLRLLVVGMLRGQIPKLGYLMVKYHMKKNPQNPLFSYAVARYTDGDYTLTKKLLLDERYWPKCRLPTSSDRCEGWILQREKGYNWEPCDKEKIHSGGTFLFLSALMKRE